MHPKRKGNIGELKIAADLCQKGYSVFTELGDISKTDLIVETEKKLIKIQVKALTSINGKVQLDIQKSGPNYRFRYNKKDVDIFAIYVLDRDLIFYVPVVDALKHRQTTYRIDPPKNNQKLLIRYVDDYKNLKLDEA